MRRHITSAYRCSKCMFVLRCAKELELHVCQVRSNKRGKNLQRSLRALAKARKAWGKPGHGMEPEELERIFRIARRAYEGKPLLDP